MRRGAAKGVLALHADDGWEERAHAIGDLLLAERDARVRVELLGALTPAVGRVPTSVDGVLARLYGDADVCDDDDIDDPAEVMLAYLAVVPKTPFASATIERRCVEAPARPTAVRRFAFHARPYLAGSAGEEQARAFAMLRTAAEACTSRLARDPAERALPASELSAAQVAEIRGAVEVCHDVAEQIYFASGAFDSGNDPSALPAVPDAGFADLAMPVLRMCASTAVPQCMHPAIETMVFLAPLDEAGTLEAVAAAVPSGSSYAGESMAGDLVVGYLRRLLTEQRRLVLFDTPGANAFRRLLATFAAAGNQDALALAYSFSDVFR